MGILVALGFWLFLLGTLAIGWQAGDRQDRGMIMIICVAAALTVAAHMIPGDTASLLAGLAVDCGLLFAVLRYALVSQRHWPMWFAAFHAAGIFTGLIGIPLPPTQRWLLEMLSAFWALPALLTVVLGLLADQRNGIANASAAGR